VDCVPQQLFGSAVAYYAQYRPGYPQDLVDALAARAGLDGAQRVLDIGCVLGDREEPDWVHAIAQIRARYLGVQRRAGTGIYSHRDVLARSPFCAVDMLTWSWSRQLTVEEVTGLQLSYSFSTPALLGDRTPAFTRDVRAAVLDLYPAGVVSEPFRVEVLIAARP
jgi:hypothetical protein